ncbi:MAG: ATP-binding protein [Verrucomicrobiota bacterium]|jgi:PAS domain S-box-containing protein
MNDPLTCRLLVISDTSDLRRHLSATLSSADPPFEIDDLPRNADSLAHFRKARASGRPYSVIFLDPGPPPSLDIRNTLAPLWAEDPGLQAVICAGPSDPTPEQIARQLHQTSHWLLLKKPWLPGESRQIALFLAHTRTPITAAEDALRAARDQYRQLFDNNPIPIYTCDHDTLRFLDANQAALQLYGYPREQLLAMTLEDIAPPEDIPAFRQRLASLSPGVGNTGAWRHRARDGKFLELEITSHTLSPGKTWLCMVMDVTERSKLEAQLRQSQKMESVGQLASGIAHDFNNLLTVITGHIGLLMAEKPASPRAADSLKEIAEASKRATDLTRQLTTFSRKQELHLQVADLNEIINHVGKMLRRILGEDIALTTDFAPRLPSIKADLGMLEQVLLNLAVNSRDAMPKGGQLLIRSSDALIEPSQTRLNPEAVAGRFVCLTFSDNGSGIAPENLSRIFEPFFTTKELGRGTGLGLATVYGIIKQHQGWIQVNSRLGEGTTFQIYLPAWHEKSAAFLMPPAEQKVLGGAHTILLVEDESPLLKLMRHILESYGYKVLDASTGKAALQTWQLHSQKIDLLLTDLVLPDGMTGFELAKTLQADKPTLQIIYTSGYDTNRLSKDLMPPADARFIQKPFHARKLAEAVFDTLSKK